ncbi:unnamed protein product [Pipistrellus nathusii]|uniref:Uncharacterized protein n=1 Tax=Pipistrellus nathusii TaxID=59473 RepID=A0ABN9ZUP7_PIPNA
MLTRREDNMETHCTLLPIYFVHLIDIRAEVIYLSIKEQHRLSFLAQGYAFKDADLISFLIDSCHLEKTDYGVITILLCIGTSVDQDIIKKKKISLFLSRFTNNKGAPCI